MGILKADDDDNYHWSDAADDSQKKTKEMGKTMQELQWKTLILIENNEIDRIVLLTTEECVSKTR